MQRVRSGTEGGASKGSGWASRTHSKGLLELWSSLKDTTLARNAAFSTPQKKTEPGRRSGGRSEGSSARGSRDCALRIGFELCIQCAFIVIDENLF